METRVESLEDKYESLQAENARLQTDLHAAVVELGKTSVEKERLEIQVAKDEKILVRLREIEIDVPALVDELTRHVWFDDEGYEPGPEDDARYRLAFEVASSQHSLNVCQTEKDALAEQLEVCQGRLAVCQASPGFGSLRELFPSILDKHFMSLEAWERDRAADAARAKADEAAYNRARQSYQETLWSQAASVYPDCGYLPDYHWLFYKGNLFR
jgi:hypothetical protein